MTIKLSQINCPSVYFEKQTLIYSPSPNEKEISFYHLFFTYISSNKIKANPQWAQCLMLERLRQENCPEVEANFDYWLPSDTLSQIPSVINHIHEQ